MTAADAKRLAIAKIMESEEYSNVSVEIEAAYKKGKFSTQVPHITDDRIVITLRLQGFSVTQDKDTDTIWWYLS